MWTRARQVGSGFHWPTKHTYLKPQGLTESPSGMRFGHTELFVADPVRARDFYTGVLGFELEAEQGPEGGTPCFIWVKSADALFLLRPGTPNEHHDFHRSSANYVIYTDNLEQSAALLRSRGLEFIGDDGPGCLTFTDPDGHWFQLVGPEGM